MLQHPPLLHPPSPGTQMPSQTPSPFVGTGFARCLEPQPGFPAECRAELHLSLCVRGAGEPARCRCAICSKNKSPDSNMMYLLWFPCRYTRHECIYYVGVRWNVNFESHFSQSIIISSLSESRNFLERKGLISVSVFKQFELGSFCKTIISSLLSQLNFARG